MVNLTDRDYLALTIYGEARGEKNAGRLAVGTVIRNRVKAGRFGPSYEAVCLKPQQFSCWNATDPNRPKLDRLSDQIRDHLAPTDKALIECYVIADCLIDGQAAMLKIRAATHYFATWLKEPPAWAASGVFVGTVGSHMFFEGVA